MQTQPEIVFEGVPATPQIKDAIDAHLAELERRWGRITACRVVVKGPGQRHRQGGLYDVHIRIALPDGREVNVTRTPLSDQRHSDLTFAVDMLVGNFRTKSARCRAIPRATTTPPRRLSCESIPLGNLDFSRPTTVRKYTSIAIAWLAAAHPDCRLAHV